MFISAVVIIVSFFLPWINVESGQVGAFSKILTGKSQATIDSISGFRIPILANSADARLMISIIKIINPNITDADKKSFLVWAIPVLAAVIFLLSLYFGKNRFLNLAFGLIGCAIFFVALYKIKTTDLDKLVLNVKIATGLWLILYSYLAIGVLGFIAFVRKKS
jgi:hypothetical protein